MYRCHRRRIRRGVSATRLQAIARGTAARAYALREFGAAARDGVIARAGGLLRQRARQISVARHMVERAATAPRERAALTIQSVWRSKNGRLAVTREKERRRVERAQREEDAATLIQGVSRRRASAKRVDGLRVCKREHEKELAALKIQGASRRRIAVRRRSELLSEADEDAADHEIALLHLRGPRDAAALTIQKAERARAARERSEEFRIARLKERAADDSVLEPEYHPLYYEPPRERRRGHHHRKPHGHHHHHKSHDGHRRSRASRGSREFSPVSARPRNTRVPPGPLKRSQSEMSHDERRETQAAIRIQSSSRRLLSQNKVARKHPGHKKAAAAVGAAKTKRREDCTPRVCAIRRLLIIEVKTPNPYATYFHLCRLDYLRERDTTVTHLG